MKRFIDVHGGDVMAGQGDVVLRSDANSACVVIAARDSVKKIGALAHAMFSSSKLKKHNMPSTILDVENAIDEMISDMKILGSQKNNIEVCLVTGENIPKRKKNPLYSRCIKSAVELLEKKHIKCNTCKPSESCKDHVLFDVESGSITYG